VCEATVCTNMYVYAYVAANVCTYLLCFDNCVCASVLRGGKAHCGAAYVCVCACLQLYARVCVHALCMYV